MAVIQLEIDEALLQAVGTQAVADFMERQLSLLRLRHLGGKIAASMEQSGFDHRAEVERAREEAWRERRVKILEPIL
jgi:hypothetical protein